MQYSILKNGFKNVLMQDLTLFSFFRVKLIDLGRESLIKRRPAYIWIRLYANDKRIRTLMMDGWHEKNLILQAEWFLIWMQTGPIVIKKPQSVIGRIRVEYNPILLENN